MKKTILLFTSIFMYILLISCEESKNQSPSMPELIDPLNGSTSISLRPLLLWSTSNDPEGKSIIYDIYYSMNNPPTNKIDTSTSNRYAVPLDLNPNTKYYWRIIANNGNGGETSSLIWYFTTKQSTLIEIDFLIANDRLLTFDTLTGLEWMDLTQTQGQSYNTIISGYNSFTTAYRFRYATLSELNTLILNAGLKSGFTTANYIPGLILINMLGQTEPLGTIHYSRGWIDPGAPNPINVSMFSFEAYDIDMIAGGAVNDNQPPTREMNQVGSFLVRSHY